MISALDGDGVADLKRYLAPRVPAGPLALSRRTSSPTRRCACSAAEITREKIYDRLHDELPYSTTVETTQLDRAQKDGSVRIEQTIFVERDSQKAHRARQGRRRPSSRCRWKREASWPRSSSSPVHLFLFVKVRENWGSDPERYREMGLKFPKE